MSDMLASRFEKTLQDDNANYLSLHEDAGIDFLSASLIVIPGPEGTVVLLSDGDRDASIYLKPGQHKQLQAYLNEWEQ